MIRTKKTFSSFLLDKFFTTKRAKKRRGARTQNIKNKETQCLEEASAEPEARKDGHPVASEKHYQRTRVDENLTKSERSIVEVEFASATSMGSKGMQPYMQRFHERGV